MRRLIILAEVALGLLFASCTKEEQRTLSVIPAPLKVELQQEVFSLNSETGLYIDVCKEYIKDLNKEIMNVYNGLIYNHLMFVLYPSILST